MNRTKYALLLSFTCSAQLYGVTDSGALLQDIEKQRTLPTQRIDLSALPKSKQDENITKSTGLKVFVTSFELKGNTLISDKELETALKAYTYKELTYSDLQTITQNISMIYSQHGYMARVILPPQEIQNGRVKLLILEGSLSDVVVEGANKENNQTLIIKKYVQSAQPTEDKISVKQIEKAVLLLNDIPGIKVVSSLEAGQRQGETVLKLKLQDVNKFQGNLYLNNYGSKNTGYEQLNLNTSMNAPFTVGDQITVQALLSSGVRYGRVDYSYPIGFSGLRVGANLSYLNYKVSNIDANGDAFTGGLNASYPLSRTRLWNAFLKFSLENKYYDNYVDSTNTSRNKIILGTTALSATAFDMYGNWDLYSSITAGSVDLSACKTNFNTDQQSAKTNGRYAKGYLSIKRNQELSNNTYMVLGLNGQISSKNLDSSEKIYLGGPFGIRAYPTNEAGGDQGYISTLELHYKYKNYDLSAFTDYGYMNQHRELYYGWQGSSTTSNGYALSDKGIALEYVRDLWNAKVTAAWKNGTNPNPQADGSDNDGTHDNYHIYFSIGRGF